MYRPPAFREDRIEVLHAAIRAHPLATLVTGGADGLMANVAPFLLMDTDGGAVLRAHLAKANEQLAALDRAHEALVVFQGPQAYVSPSFYPSKKDDPRVVPTWNYVVVQVRGRPRLIRDAAWLRAQIDTLTHQQERARAEAWAVEDAPPEFVTAQLKGIVGVEIMVERIEGKWKTSQNRSAADRQGVADGMREADAAMADLVAGSINA